MQIRKDQLVTGNYYHIFSRSIAKFVIFNNQEEFLRMRDIVHLCQFANFNYRFSKYIKLDSTLKNQIYDNLLKSNEKLVEIIAYCLMPTHIHLILRQISDNGISKFMARILNSYSRYFNQKHGRIGPLWSGRFKNVFVSSDSQLLHLTRYLHLNPTSAGLTEKPEEWQYSSYKEYIHKNDPDEARKNICVFDDVIEITPSKYAEFVMDRKDYQREISKIKKLLIEDYTG